jgi:DNA-binding MarR family transcriptional regulator
MDREWNSDLRISNRAAATLPPAMIGETGWDILLVLGEGRSGLTVVKMASMLSVPRAALARWLGWLEERALVASGRDRLTEQFGAVITPAGRELVDNHFLAASSLQGRH